MTILLIAIVAAALAAIPAAMFWTNLRLFPAAPDAASDLPAVSVLIPARDEEPSIAACVGSVLANRGIEIELIVLDDHSRDQTAQIIRTLTATDGRVRLEQAPPLPADWCGKQHACAALAKLARHDVLMFIDADVTLAPDAVARAVTFLRQSGAGLVSGFPRQVTGSFLEKLLLPLIHFVLLGFLPIGRMRASKSPAYGAGCGQFFVTWREAYERAGTHAAIRRSLHDGVTLPRAFRAAGLATDLFNATSIASCRMYHGNAQTWRGLGKNATEGMASAAAIVPWTLLLGVGQVLPLVLLGGLIVTKGSTVAFALGASATLSNFALRIAAARRFKQSILGALLHPLGVLLLLLIQWQALGRRLIGQPATWRGRAYPARV